MSWSFSQSGPVSVVRQALKATFQGNPLAEPEQTLRHKVAEDFLGQIESKVGANFEVTCEASGSQTVVDKKVVGLSLNVSITG